MSDPLDLAGQADAENDRRHLSTIARKDETARWAWLMSGPQGRRIVWDMLDLAGVYRSTFSTNGSQMAFLEGRRDMGLRVMAQAQTASPENFRKMMEEAHERATGNG